jgi:hypothetical protein
MVKEENKNNPDIKDTLKMISNLLQSKCRYYLDHDYNLCFQVKGGKEFEKSNESGLVTLLGVFACLRINLKYFEQQNPELEGLNMLFTALYPEIMDAYDKVTKKFGFDGTVKLGLNISDPDELLLYLKNMKIERWKENGCPISDVSKNLNEKRTADKHGSIKTNHASDNEFIETLNEFQVSDTRVCKSHQKSERLTTKKR